MKENKQRRRRFSVVAQTDVLVFALQEEPENLEGRRENTQNLAQISLISDPLPWLFPIVAQSLNSAGRGRHLKVCSVLVWLKFCHMWLQGKYYQCCYRYQDYQRYQYQTDSIPILILILIAKIPDSLGYREFDSRYPGAS